MVFGHFLSSTPATLIYSAHSYLPVNAGSIRTSWSRPLQSKQRRTSHCGGRSKHTNKQDSYFEKYTVIIFVHILNWLFNQKPTLTVMCKFSRGNKSYICICRGSGRVFKTTLTIKLDNWINFIFSPWVVLHRLPVFSIREAELRNDPQLILCLPHELEASLQLQHNRKPNFHYIFYILSCAILLHFVYIVYMYILLILYVFML